MIGERFLKKYSSELFDDIELEGHRNNLSLLRKEFIIFNDFVPTVTLRVFGSEFYLCKNIFKLFKNLISMVQDSWSNVTYTIVDLTPTHFLITLESIESSIRFAHSKCIEIDSSFQALSLFATSHLLGLEPLENLSNVYLRENYTLKDLCILLDFCYKSHLKELEEWSFGTIQKSFFEKFGELVNSNAIGYIPMELFAQLIDQSSPSITEFQRYKMAREYTLCHVVFENEESQKNGVVNSVETRAKILESLKRIHLLSDSPSYLETESGALFDSLFERIRFIQMKLPQLEQVKEDGIVQCKILENAIEFEKQSCLTTAPYGSYL